MQNARSRVAAEARAADAGAPLVIVIRPSMGFGTGHHATTRLCLLALQQLDLTARRVIDVGAGSGVLAIAACRLGAGDSLGIDDDPDALAAARDNLALNPGTDVTLRLADLRTMQGGEFDVVIANLTGALHQAAAGRLSSLAAPGAHFILGGFTRDEEDAVRTAFAACHVSARSEEDEWVCLTLNGS
jgi:ribosomal protein L11 methyltransferase